MAIFDLFEPKIDNIAAKVERRINDIWMSKFSDYDDVVLFLRSIISEYYKIPIFSNYFNDLTLEQLITEIEIIKKRTGKSSDYGSRLLRENKKEAESLFDDWDDLDTKMTEEEFMREAERFMKTGEFKATGGNK